MSKQVRISFLRPLAALASALFASSVWICPVLAEPDNPCENAAGYVMPNGVELSDAPQDGVAPADLDPSPIRQALPQSYRFPLAVDPLPNELPNASIDLGEIAVDAQSGKATLNGAPLSKNDAADAAAGCAR